jgi:DNA-binding beta-propeller fold protein YncE
VAGPGPKLYIAEEDSLDGSFGEDGYIAVFDISNPRQPRFLKRFKPGDELPADYCIAHAMTVTPDGQSLYVASYACSYIVKIDTTTDEVVKVYGPADGLNRPHGGFIAGSLR